MIFIQMCNHPEKENIRIEQVDNMGKAKRPKVTVDKKITSKAMGKTKVTKEDRIRLMEEKKLQKEVCLNWQHGLMFILYVFKQIITYKIHCTAREVEKSGPESRSSRTEKT